MTRDLGVWAAPDCALVLTVVVGLAEVTGIGLVVDGGMKVHPAQPALRALAILVGLGVAVSGWALLGRRGSQVHS